MNDKLFNSLWTKINFLKFKDENFFKQNLVTKIIFYPT